MKEIKLTQGKIATIDDDVFESIKGYSWCTDGIYAKGYINGKQILMHRFILDAQPGEQIDHVNGNTLDNRKRNLRKCTQSQNQMNKHAVLSATGYKGVHFYKPTQKYCAQIWVGKNIHLGYFRTATEAAEVYDNAAILAYGEFAMTNRSINEQRIR